MAVHHHPPEAFLLDYAAGALGEGESIIVASHLALCPACRDEVARFEAIGGVLFDEIDEAPVSDACLSSMFARLDADGPLAAPASLSIRRDRGSDSIRFSDCQTGDRERGIRILPQPLRGYVGCDVCDVRWKPVIKGLEECTLDIGCSGTKVRLMRIRAGVAMPQHSHHGHELTLVLSGGFSDAGGHYLRGDMCVTDSDVDHRPVADEDSDCICVAATDAPLRLTGKLGRFLNPFVRF